MLYEDEDVKEALKRLPQQIKDERTFRIVRAMLLDANKRILPKEQWTKLEDVSKCIKYCYISFNLYVNLLKRKCFAGCTVPSAIHCGS